MGVHNFARIHFFDSPSIMIGIKVPLKLTDVLAINEDIY
jgi:hypothetical protein